MIIYAATDLDDKPLGIFYSLEVAEASWELTYASAMKEVTFKHRKVFLGDEQVGKIKEWIPCDMPEHL